MAGTLDNTFLAVIHHPDNVPQEYKLDAELRYRGDFANARPWEQEALWAGDVENMTADALRVCSDKDIEMWEYYEPTPKTREWLESRGHM